MANIKEQMKIFPHVTEQIFGYLDIRCLVKCREISKSWKLFIEKSRCSSVKMIKAIVQQLQPSVEIQKFIERKKREELVKKSLEMTIEVDKHNKIQQNL